MIVRRLPWAFKRGQVVGQRSATGWTTWGRKAVALGDIILPRYRLGLEASTIRGLRELHGVSRREMARRLRMSTVEYHKLETGVFVLPSTQWRTAISLARTAG